MYIQKDKEIKSQLSLLRFFARIPVINAFFFQTTRVFLHLQHSTTWLSCCVLNIVPNPYKVNPSSRPSFLSFFLPFFHITKNKYRKYMKTKSIPSFSPIGKGQRSKLVKFQFSFHFRSDTLFQIPLLLH